MKYRLLMVMSLGVSLLTAQQDPFADNEGGDPFLKSKQRAQSRKSGGPANGSSHMISICYEVFSLPLAEVAKLRRQGLEDTELYAEILKRLESGKVKQESFAFLKSRSGERAILENVTQHIYATEFEPPEPPGYSVVGASNRRKDGAAPTANTGALVGVATGESMADLRTPATPSSFEVMKLGFTMEYEVSVSKDQKLIELYFSPDHTTLVGTTNYGQGIATALMPEFEVQKIQTGGIMLAPGKPSFIGTMSRPGVSKIDENSATTVWCAFVTGDFAKP